MTSISKISTFYHTTRYLKSIQISARFILYIRKLVPYRHNWKQHSNLFPQKLVLKDTIESNILNSGMSFNFLNLTKNFKEQIDWNYIDNGRLWAYNLNYFEFLNQKGMSSNDGLQLIDDFIFNLSKIKIGFEPYPLSLRCINWIRFFSKHKINNSRFDSILFNQLYILTKKLEYHLLGNHLLENGFALLFGAYYFNDKKLYKKAKKILISQLNEQILADGGHFELSPMYHSIILFRILDCYNLVINNNLFEQELKSILSEKSTLMMSWLNTMTFKNGDYPLMNDAAFKIAPTSNDLKQYAIRLGIPSNIETNLNESGYRKFANNKFELIADFGSIGPDYQPGHAHADTFSFELHINGRPLIVDTGTSTYEVNDHRFSERSTAAHNTVVVANENSSEVWSGHRVGRRAKVKIIKESQSFISASHNGYADKGVIHNRIFKLSDDRVCIEDQIRVDGIAYFHFSPNENIKVESNAILGEDYLIYFNGAVKIEVYESLYAPEFNKQIKNISVSVSFWDKLITNIK